MQNESVEWVSWGEGYLNAFSLYVFFLVALLNHTDSMWHLPLVARVQNANSYYKN